MNLDEFFEGKNNERYKVDILVEEMESIESYHKKGFSYGYILEALSKIKGVKFSLNNLNGAKRKLSKQTKPIVKSSKTITETKPITFTPNVKTEARKEEKLTTKTDEKCVNEEALTPFYFEGNDINSVKFSQKHVDNYEAFMKHLATNFDENFFNGYDWDWEKYTPLRHLKKDDYSKELVDFLTEKDFVQTCVFYAGVRSEKLDRGQLNFALGNVLNARMEAHRYKNQGKDNYVNTRGPL